MSTPTPSPPPLTLLSTLPSPTGHGTRAWQTTPHPSPSHPILATASSDKSVSIWSLRDFRLLSTITNGHKRSIRTVDWKDYGTLPTTSKKRKLMLATGSFDANVGIWEHNPSASNPAPGLSIPDPMTSSDVIEKDMTTSEEDEEWLFSTLLTGPDSEIKSISFSPPHYSANFLATSSRDKSVWVWEEVEDEEWETVAVLQDHAGDVKSVSWCEGARLRLPLSSSHQSGRNGDAEGHYEPTANSSEDIEERIIGAREILASSSYDDTIRLYRDVESEGDWVCVGVISSHTGTVWCVKWEKYINLSLYPDPSSVEIEWEPRLISSSDDLTVRVWRRELSESEREKKRDQMALNGTSSLSIGGSAAAAAAKLPSIIRPTSVFEKWVQDAILPEVHVRSIYAVDWSRQTGLVVSCGGDGTIALYRETPVSTSSTTTTASDTTTPYTNKDDADIIMKNASETHQPQPQPTSTWTTISLTHAAHNEYEINHICFAPRRDRDKRFDSEEVIVSTGDDGDVKIWILPDEVVRSFGLI